MEAEEETRWNQCPEQRQGNKAAVRLGWENPSGQGKRGWRGAFTGELAVQPEERTHTSVGPE